MAFFNDINLLIFDFDGVMTDNRVLMSENGTEFVLVSRADGMGINIIKGLNIQMLILSTEVNEVVKARAQKLGIEAINGLSKKDEMVRSYCKEHNFNLDKVAYVGNDVNDYNAMQLVGLKICPYDSHESIKNISNIILNTRGGYGVVRELADIILKERNNYGE